MIYRFNISTPANTTKEDPLLTPLKLTRGVIHQIDVDFPPGAEETLNIGILWDLNQVWPTNPEQAFAADDRKITFKEHFEIMRSPYRLIAKTWNTSTANPHAVTIRIGVLPRKVVLRRVI